MTKRKGLFLLVMAVVFLFFISACNEQDIRNELIISGIPFGLRKAAIKSVNISKELIDLLIESNNSEYNITIKPGLTGNYKFDADELEVIDRYKPDGSIRYLKFICKGDPRIFLVKGGRERNIFFPNLTLKPGTPLDPKNDISNPQRASVSVIALINDLKEKNLHPGESFIIQKDETEWIFKYIHASVLKTEVKLSGQSKIATESPHFLVDWIAYRK